MTNTVLDTIPAPPVGYRYLSAHEAETMAWGDPIVLMTPAGKEHALIRGFKDDAMTVMLRSGAIIVLDLDSPDYWPDSVTRDRRPPLNAVDSIVAIRPTDATPDDEIEPLLRVGTAVERMAKNDPELKAALAEVRRIFLDRLKGKAAA